ncbi:unnamed protein product [Adineta ricciae]|uniref:Interferon-induced transmembrane protein n=1 Tax=Adineta ricciae TaxID=249248 RepID=A0A813NSU9_ADIRI|nr:unnamed protein product [Adineta ricciae]CAF1293019.1 unnamed protein product [Adineta ricciae]
MKEMNYSAPYPANATMQPPPPPSSSQPPLYYPPQVQYVSPAATQNIRDWLPWSIINIFIGWGLAGVLPLVFSILCRSHKRSNDFHSAQTMSKLALVFNILITIGGVLAWIGFIVWLVLYIKVINDIVGT